MARQRTFFHKCHRCIYRGKAANWEPSEPQQLTIELDVPEPSVNGTGHPPAPKKAASVSQKMTAQKMTVRKKAGKKKAHKKPTGKPAATDA